MHSHIHLKTRFQFDFDEMFIISASFVRRNLQNDYLNNHPKMDGRLHWIHCHVYLWLKWVCACWCKCRKIIIITIQPIFTFTRFILQYFLQFVLCILQSVVLFVACVRVQNSLRFARYLSIKKPPKLFNYLSKQSEVCRQKSAV